MDRHRRDPAPKSFDAVTARTCDDRFYGVVVHEFSPGRSTAPEAVEMLGQNLSPATLKMKSSSQGNLINLKVGGINRLDVWVSPKLIDFKRKLEVRINDRPRFKGSAKLTLDPFARRPSPARRPPASVLAEGAGRLTQPIFVERHGGSPNPRMGS